ncbi:MAG: putative quinol monooxygenase [Pseudomonadota bacterium]
MYLVAVTFDVDPAHAAAFTARVAQQATDSLTEEGCHRFDVWTDPAEPARIFLFEIYTDRAAFDVHLASTHFKAFDAEVGPWVQDKAVETWTLS